MNNNIYTKKHLLLALKEAGLPFSYPTLIAYEKAGIIPQPDSKVSFADRNWRFYTGEEIENIVSKVKNYCESKKK
jgi:hypothetical protein